MIEEDSICNKHSICFTIVDLIMRVVTRPLVYLLLINLEKQKNASIKINYHCPKSKLL